MTLIRFLLCLLLSCFLPLIGESPIAHEAANLSSKSIDDYLDAKDQELPLNKQISKLEDLRDTFRNKAVHYEEEAQRSLFIDNGWARQLQRKSYRYEKEAEHLDELIEALNTKRK